MHLQLQAVVDEFEHAHIRLRSLARALPEELWTRRPDEGRWSIAECVSHINLTSTAYLPLLRRGVATGRLLDGPPPVRYRRDLIGWLLWRTAGPPVRLRVKTTAAFIPHGSEPPSKLIDEFERLGKEQIECVREADGLPLGRIKIASPFNPRVKYNLFACLTILPRHQHRHLWQAEQAWRVLRRAVASGN
jgi:DinB superfamily